MNMDELVEPAYLVEFLDNRKHHQEMLTRAMTRIEDENIHDYQIYNCTYCTEQTFIKEDGRCKCYLCHHEEDTFECQNCGEDFLEYEFEDFFDAFETDYSEGRVEVYNNFGYSHHTACQSCTSEIREDIRAQIEQDHYNQMMEDYYQDQKAVQHFTET